MRILFLSSFLILLGPAKTLAGANFGPGNFTFPQNRDNPFGFHSSIYNNADIIAAYDKWYTDCVTSSGAGGFLRVQRPNDSGLFLNSTVSEGIGYGLVIAVYMNDENLFDNIWKYEQTHLDRVDGTGLMNWYIDSGGGTAGSGAAADGDEDMAWGLLMASRQWGGSGTLGTTYLSLAINQINNIYNHEVSGGNLMAGDTFSAINPSYFAPAYYQEFAAVTTNAGWLTVAANCY
ncbi:MAG TPA: glycosyl hydrolase family 8, partial [bacterium]